MDIAALHRRAFLAVMLMAAPGVHTQAGSVQETKPAAAVDAAREEERALERAEAEKLRRLREAQEMRRKEAARRLDAEQARQTETGRLRTTVMGLEQRESTLHHDTRSIQQQLGTVSRDPTDHSAVMRRYELERQLGRTQNDLDYVTRSRESATRGLDALRFR